MCLTIDKIDLIKVTQSQIVDLVVRFCSSSCSERGVINPASFNRSEEKRKSKGQCSFACYAQCCFRGKDGRWSHQSHLYRLTYMRCDIAMVVGCRYGTLNGRIRKKWVFCSNDPLLIRWLIISCEEGMSWAWLIHEEIRKNVIWKNLAKKGILLHWSLDGLLHWTFPKKRRLMILLWLIFFYKGNILTNI